MPPNLEVFLKMEPMVGPPRMTRRVQSLDRIRGPIRPSLCSTRHARKSHFENFREALNARSVIIPMNMDQIQLKFLDEALNLSLHIYAIVKLNNQGSDTTLCRNNLINYEKLTSFYIYLQKNPR